MFCDGTAEITKYKGREKEIEIPSEMDGITVTGIGKKAFFGRKSLKSVTIPEGVTSIGKNAFSCCENLTSVTLPYSVTRIGDEAFYLCKSLTSLTLPDSVSFIGKWAFYGCISLSSLKIPGSVTVIDQWAFSHCEGLTSLTFPDGVINMGHGIFANCDSLTSVTIPDSVTEIGGNPFMYCCNLKEIKISPKNRYFALIDGALISKSDMRLIYCPVCSKGEYAVPKGIRIIGGSAFSGCKSLTSVVISDSVMRIGDWAFWDCANDLTLIVPQGSYAEEYCREYRLKYRYSKV